MFGTWLAVSEISQIIAKHIRMTVAQLEWDFECDFAEYKVWLSHVHDICVLYEIVEK